MMKWYWIALIILIATVFILHFMLENQKQDLLREAQSYLRTRDPNYQLKDPLEWSNRHKRNSGCPVDVVFTWVDGSDPNFIAIKNKFKGESNNELHEDAIRDNRWADNGELLQSIQSVKTYTPWVRNIYVVTSLFQTPSWYPKNHKDVIFVNDTEIFANNTSALPVFNSHAIESNIWRIPGLAEHFIYFNDDMFLGKPLTKDQFFVNNGQKFNLYVERGMYTGDVHKGMATWLAARKNTGNLFNEVFGEEWRPLTHHFARPLLKSVCKEAWDHPKFRKYLNNTSKSKFRDHNDIAPIELFSLYGLETGKAEVGFIPDKLYQGLLYLGFIKPNNLHIGIPNIGHLALLSKNLEDNEYSMYCINDTVSKKDDDFNAALKYILKTKLPHHYLRLTSIAK
jgi:hypothetical protein